MTEKTKETMMTYIEESPKVVAENLDRCGELTAGLAEEYMRGDYRNIWIVASGSSYNGSYCARQFVRRYLKCEVKILPPFSFICSEHDFTDQDFVFVVSQGGYSTNSIEALDVIRKRGRKAVGITGDMGSDLGRHADLLVDYGVGVETVGYVTKGVTGFALFLMLFALEAGVRKGVVSQKEAEEAKKELQKVPDIHRMVQSETKSFFRQHYKEFTSMTNAYVCGCGANYGTALEGALKIGETIQVPSVAYESEEYLHGPCLQVTPNYTLLFVDGGCASERVHQIFEGSRRISDRSFLLTNQKKYQGEEGVLCIPFDLQEPMTPLCFLPFFQIVSHQVTTDLKRWHKHPLQQELKKAASCKTENYVNRDEE